MLSIDPQPATCTPPAKPTSRKCDVDDADHFIIVRVVTNALHRSSAGDVHTTSNVGLLLVDANQHLGSLVDPNTLVDDAR